MSSFPRFSLVCGILAWSSLLFLHESSEAHPMDSYAIDQYLDFRIRENKIQLIHRIEFAEIPTASELPRIDTDKNMSLSTQETVPYVEATVKQLLDELVLTVDGKPLTWQYLRGEAFLDTIPSTRLKVVTEYRTSFPGNLEGGRLFRFDLRHRPGARGDRQTRIVVRGKAALREVSSSENTQPPGMAPPSIHDTAALVYGHKVQWTLVPSETEAPDDIPDFSIRQATGPVSPENPFLSLNNRDLDADILGETAPSQPAGIAVSSSSSRPDLRNEGTPSFAEGVEKKERKETWADRKFREMFMEGGTKRTSTWALVGFTLLALLYGAAHALEPGHGKTVVAAYLVGAHGTVFHAVLLALIVTFTHTFSVYILGIIALTNLEKVQGTYLPILECGSWFLIMCMGIWLFLKYYKYYVQGKLADPTFHTHGFGEGHSHLPAGGHSHSHDHGHPHHHHHEHGHEHSHEHPHHEHEHPHPHHHHHHTHEHHDHEHTHSHDHHHHPHHDHPLPHTHEEPSNTEVGFWNLLVLGVTGGIVPCPGALFVMMIALSSGAVLTGLYLISVFSIGLALTLMAVGITVVKSRGVIDKYAPNSRLVQLVPVGTSLVIFLVGLGFTINGLVKHGIVTLNL